MKDVDLGEPTSFLDHVFLGCTQGECQISNDIVANYRDVFESRISAGATEKLTETKAMGNTDAETISSWSYDMEGHAKKCVERYCELAKKTTEQLCHACMIINSEKKKLDQLENCPQFAHKLFRNVYIWHVLVDLIFYGL